MSCMVNTGENKVSFDWKSIEMSNLDSVILVPKDDI
jgi:hypothetical protein